MRRTNYYSGSPGRLLSQHASLLFLLFSYFACLPKLAAQDSQAVLGLAAPSTLTDDILSAAQDASITRSCASCQALLIPLKRLAAFGDESFVNAIVRLCKVRKLADPDICEGDVAAQGPIIAHSLRQISTSGRTATLLCNSLFGLCDTVPIKSYNVSFPKSNVKPKHVSRGRTPFQVVHLSDVHIDREYTVGAEANCTKYICCRDFAPEGGSGNISDPAEPFGNTRCDSPIQLADSMLGAIRELVPDARFTISSGDVVDHANWLLSQSAVEDELHSFHKQLFANLSDSNAFYGSFGNHDTYPTNSFPRSTADDADGTQWAFDLVGNDWERWIGEKGATSVRHKSGSYAIVHPGTKLRLISINTQYWYKFNFWLYDSDDFQPDPNGILAFLVSELHTAEQAGQRAWIFGHIPPGSSDVMRDQSNYFDQIVHRYRTTISAQFYGHTHFDQFQIAYSNYSDQTAENAISFGLVAPSLTPTNGNPAFTVYDVDPDTYEIMDSKVYITNMSEPTFQVHPKWKLYYSARDSYGPLVASLNESSPPSNVPVGASGRENIPRRAPLDAAFWHQLTEVFLVNDTSFQLFKNRTYRSAPRFGRRKCDDECKNKTICDMRAMRAEDSCFTAGLSEIIRGDSDSEVSDEWSVQHFPELEAHSACEGSALPAIMRRLISASNWGR